MIPEPNLPLRPNPCCGYRVDAAESLESLLDGAQSAEPRAGDLTLCLNCGALLAFIDAASNLTRSAYRKDIDALNSKQRRTLARAQKYIRARGWIASEAFRRNRS